MAKKKPNPVPLFMSLQEALDQLENPEILFDLLKDGTLVAYGRLGDFDDHPLYRAPGPTIIPSITWQDYEFNLEKFTLSSQDHREGYFEIKIKRDDLNEISESTNPKNPGGRPPKDWEAFFLEVVIDHHNNGRPDSIEEWAIRLSGLEMWNGKPPDERTLEKKLGPLYWRLKGET